MTQPSLSDLIAQMNGVPTTNRWDIVVSYSVNQLNEFLKDSYQDGPLSNHKVVNVQSRDCDEAHGESYTLDFTINFQAPTIQFVTGIPSQALLTMPIDQGSQYSVTPDGAEKPTRIVDIPGGVYSVVAMVPLASISGDKKQIADQGRVITFQHGVTSEQYIVLHFQTNTGTFRITPEPDPALKHCLESLRDYFVWRVDELDYKLCGVSNRPDSKARYPLTPESFAFASTGTDIGCLSLFIQTSESKNSPGNSAPSFQPGDVQLPPVPAEYTASIILSHDLVTKTLIQKQLEGAGYTVTVPDEAPSRGASLTLQKDVSVVVEGRSGRHCIDNYAFDGLSIKMTDYPVRLVIADRAVSVCWSGHSSSGWAETIGASNLNYGTVDVTIEMKKGPLSISVSDEGVDFPSFTFKQGDFKVQTKGQSCTFGQRVMGCVEWVPRFYSEGMTFEIPAINFDLLGLDYFLETNLLEPNKQMIIVDSTAGLSTPHDFVVVGDVKSD